MFSDINNACRAKQLFRVVDDQYDFPSQELLRLSSLATCGSPALEKLEAERKGRTVQNETELHERMSPFVGRYEPDRKTVTIKGKQLALLVIPKCFPDNDTNSLLSRPEFNNSLPRLIID